MSGRGVTDGDRYLLRRNDRPKAPSLDAMHLRMTLAALILAPTLLLAAASPMALAGGGTTHKSKISMIYVPDITPVLDSFEGQVTSSKTQCTVERKVKVYREKSGDDALIGSAKSADEGFWFVHVSPATAGSYYAKVKKREIGNKQHEQTCKAAVSATIEVSATAG